MTEGYKDDRYAFVDAYLATGHHGPEADEELISVAIVDIGSTRRMPHSTGLDCILRSLNNWPS